MRDEYDSRLWADHHERFSDTVDVVLKALRSALSRLPTWDGTSQHLLALVASFAITAISFNGTTV
jgi:hypothetical protein